MRSVLSIAKSITRLPVHVHICLFVCKLVEIGWIVDLIVLLILLLPSSTLVGAGSNCGVDLRLFLSRLE